jgi:DNA (cytosine-5)-methyltransferase 1
MTRPLRCADLFAGAGGTSTGLARAAEASGRDVELLAVNHWEVAVATHAANHPGARHIHASLEGIDPARAIGARKLDVLVASPECTHHSSARGGRPINDQSRASAWHVLSWAQAVEPEWIIVENVPDLLTWGPIGRNHRPIKSRKGETFRAWVTAIESLGYRVAWRVLNAADFGDPTTRRRLFVIARRGRRSPTWPDATHRDPRIGSGLFDGALPAWRTARDSVIDWTLRGSSIFGRKRSLAEATLRRIAEGIRRFAGPHAEDFLMLLRGTGSARSCDAPVPALTAGGTHLELASYVVPVGVATALCRAAIEGLR